MAQRITDDIERVVYNVNGCKVTARTVDSYGAFYDGKLVGYYRYYTRAEMAAREARSVAVQRELRQAAYAELHELYKTGMLGARLAEMSAEEFTEAVLVVALARGKDPDEVRRILTNLMRRSQAVAASADEALAMQLTSELSEMHQNPAAHDMRRYDAKSAQMWALGYDVGPDGMGGLCLYDTHTQKPLAY